MPCERAKRTASDSEMENENCKKQQNMKLRNLIKQIKIINPALDDDLPTVHPLCTSIRSPAYYFPTVGIWLKLSHPCVFHRYTSNHIPCFPVHFTFQVDARFEWHIFCDETMKSYTMDSNSTSCSRADCAFHRVSAQWQPNEALVRVPNSENIVLVFIAIFKQSNFVRQKSQSDIPPLSRFR